MAPAGTTCSNAANVNNDGRLDFLTTSFDSDLQVHPHMGCSKD